jgi:hypothetical protein
MSREIWTFINSAKLEQRTRAVGWNRAFQEQTAKAASKIAEKGELKCTTGDIIGTRRSGGAAVRSGNAANKGRNVEWQKSESCHINTYFIKNENKH